MKFNLSVYGLKLSKVVLQIFVLAFVLALSTLAMGQGSDRNSTLIVGTSFNLITLDPGRSFELTAIFTNKALYETLVTLPPDGNGGVIPLLATSWEASGDGLTYTFTLRDGVRFSSGNPLTAADVVWSIERFKGLKGSASFLASTIESVAAPDPSTAVIQLNQPDPAILSKLTVGNFAVLDSKTLIAQGGTSGPDADQTDQAEQFLDGASAGSGPYVLASTDLSSQVVMQRNPNYWRAAAPLDTYILSNIPAAAVQKLTLEAGDIDIALDVSPDQAQSLRDNPDLKVLTPPSLTTIFLGFNQDPQIAGGTVNRVGVEQAVRSALDYEGIRSLGGPGSVTPGSVVPVGLRGALDLSEAAQRDLDKARQLLADAGFASGLDLELEYPGSFTFANVDFDVVAQKVQADLAEVGIRAKLTPSPVDTFFTRLRAGEIPFFLSFWVPDFLDALNYAAFLPGGVYDARVNWSAVSDTPAYQQLQQFIQQAEITTDGAQRAELFRQAQRLLQTDGPFVPLLQPSLTIATRANVEGFVFNPQWRIDPYLVSKR